MVNGLNATSYFCEFFWIHLKATERKVLFVPFPVYYLWFYDKSFLSIHYMIIIRFSVGIFVKKYLKVEKRSFLANVWWACVCISYEITTCTHAYTHTTRICLPHFSACGEYKWVSEACVSFLRGEKWMDCASFLSQILKLSDTFFPFLYPLFLTSDGTHLCMRKRGKENVVQRFFNLLFERERKKEKREQWLTAFYGKIYL